MLNLETIWIDGPENITPEYVTEAYERMERIEERANEVFEQYADCFGKFSMYSVQKVEFGRDDITFSLERLFRGEVYYETCTIPAKYFYMDCQERIAQMQEDKASSPNERIKKLRAELAQAEAEIVLTKG